MNVLDQVTQMRQEGHSDDEIISNLRNQNPKISPKEINEALNHAQIKSAVSDVSGQNSNFGNFSAPQQSSQDNSYPEQAFESAEDGQGSAQNGEDQAYSPGSYGQGSVAGDYSQQQGYGNQEYDQQQDYYQPQNYSQQQGYGDGSQGGYAPSAGSDTMVEISEQVFEEKSREINSKLNSFEEFKNLAQSKIDRMSNQLKRMEAIMDKLQAAILEKVGSYGQDLSSIKKEMSMMQDSFSKTLNPLLDIAQGKKQKESKEQKEEKPKKKKSSKK